MLRREFLNAVFASSAVIFTSGLSFAAEKKINGIRFDETTINAGLQSPLKFLHVSDSHIVGIDERDSDRAALAASRAKAFAYAPRFFMRTMEYAAQNNITVLSTGDVSDFITHKNIEFLKANMGGDNNCIFAVGNHEFSRYVGTKKEREHNAESVALIQSCFKYDISFSSHVVGGLNIIAVDNTQYQFSSRQIEQLKAEARKGLPMLVMFHIPIYTEKFFDTLMKLNKGKSAYIAGVPDEKLALYPSKGMRDSHRPTKQTLEFINILKKEPLVKGVLCGHVHDTVRDILPNGATMVSIEAGASGAAQIINVK